MGTPLSGALPPNNAANFGVIGLAVMGENLALNIEEHGFPVVVWNYETEWVERFTTKYGAGRKFTGTKTLEEFVRALQRPRRMLMMIKAGDPVDQTLSKLAPLLEPGDIVIDGGNSWFKDTQRREASLKERKLNFFGMGVSGGEEGARHGPSLMPGGDRRAYDDVAEVLKAISAKTDSGDCITYVGPDGAGHFVKMVHNGIEYGDMQLIAEAYDILRRGAGLSAQQASEVFARWNRGPLESFLIQITAEILTVMDPATNKPLVEMILDQAGQKGTGKWTAQVALDLGVPIPTIAAAIDARVLSSMKEERVKASAVLSGPAAGLGGEGVAAAADLEQALFASKVCSYAQGMSLIGSGSAEYKWNIELREMARIWKGGCIIRARFLDDIMRAFEADPGLPNLLVDPGLSTRVQAADSAWRKTLMLATKHGIPTPAMSSALAYFDSYRTRTLPQNLTQAQRDYFGAHTYQRVDAPKGPPVHTEWETLVKKVTS